MCNLALGVRRSSSVQFYSCQTQHSPFLCKLFTFYIPIFFIQNTLYTAIWSQVDREAEEGKTFMLLDPLNLFFVYLTTWHFSWNTRGSGLVNMKHLSFFDSKRSLISQRVLVIFFKCFFLFDGVVCIPSGCKINTFYWEWHYALTLGNPSCLQIHLSCETLWFKWVLEGGFKFM